MIRFAWTRFRTQAAVGAGVLAIAAIVLLVTGIQLAHAYDAAVAACKQHGDCAGLFNAFLTQGYFTAGKLLEAVGLAVPGLIGMFWGAPLVARELETGTFRLAWTQGVTRTRWLAAKLAIAGVAAIAAGELFTLMVTWWSSPIHKATRVIPRSRPAASTRASRRPGTRRSRSPSGSPPGSCIRRTLPAMAVTLAVFTAVIIAFPIWVRPHLIPPVRTTSALSLASVAVTGSTADGHLILTDEHGCGPTRRLGHLQPGHHPGRPRRLQRASRGPAAPHRHRPRHATTTSKAFTSGRR